MRPTNLSSLTRHLQSPPAAQAPVDARHSDRIVSFRGSRGEFLRIAALDKDTVRVQVWPEGRPRLDRSWVIANVSTPRYVPALCPHLALLSTSSAMRWTHRCSLCF